MPASFNKVILLGNLTRDPEVRTTPSGTKIAKLGLAVNRRYRSRDNELKEEVTYVDIDAFAQQAELLERYTQKGSPLFVEGRLRLDQWEGPNGEKRSKLCVVMENFQFLSGGDSPSPGGQEEHGAGSERSAPVDSGNQDSGRKPSASKTGKDDFQEDDEVPF